MNYHQDSICSVTQIWEMSQVAQYYYTIHVNML